MDQHACYSNKVGLNTERYFWWMRCDVSMFILRSVKDLEIKMRKLPVWAKHGLCLPWFFTDDPHTNTH